MQLGIQVTAEVRHSVPASSNYRASSSPITKTDGTHLYGAELVDVMGLKRVLNEIEKIAKSERYLNEKRHGKAYVHLKAEAVMRAGYGNCAELSWVTAHKLLERGKTFDLVSVHSKKDKPTTPEDPWAIPHVFAVVGRVNDGNRQTSKIDLPITWGPDAVIIDPWDRVVYPAAQYESFWGALREAANGNTLFCKLELSF